MRVNRRLVQRENIERLKQALLDALEDPEVENISADDLLGDYPAVEYSLPDGSANIDILTRLGDAFAFADWRSSVFLSTA